MDRYLIAAGDMRPATHLPRNDVGTARADETPLLAISQHLTHSFPRDNQQIMLAPRPSPGSDGHLVIVADMATRLPVAVPIPTLFRKR